MADQRCDERRGFRRVHRYQARCFQPPVLSCGRAMNDEINVRHLGRVFPNQLPTNKIRNSMKNQIAGFILVALFLGSASAEQGRKRFATVMTYNIYQGTELEHVLAATDLSSFVAGVTTDYANVIATSFPERAQAIAAEIAQNAPDLVALQEVALWRTRVPSDPSLPATDVAYDFLAILLDALNAAGQHYATVIVRNNFDTQGTGFFPSVGFFDVRLTDRTALLARTDLSK